ncbi:MAG TPA: helix-turn-helix transcriptional regulator [Oculatellaceae cyanobacterium]
MRKQKSYEEELAEAVSEVFRERRMLLGYTRQEVSRLTGLHRSYIGDLERSGRNISVSNLSRMAEALRISPSKLLAKAERRLEQERVR